MCWLNQATYMQDFPLILSTLVLLPDHVNTFHTAWETWDPDPPNPLSKACALCSIYSIFLVTVFYSSFNVHRALPLFLHLGLALFRLRNRFFTSLFLTVYGLSTHGCIIIKLPRL